MLKKLVRYFKGTALLCAIIAPLMMGLEVVMDLIQPTLMSDIIDIGIAGGNMGFVWATGKSMLLVAAIGLLGGAGCAIFSSVASIRLGQALRQDLFDKIQTLSFSELDQFKTSSLITRLTNDVTQVQNMVLMGLRIMVRAPLLCIGGLVMAITLSPSLSVVFLVAVPIIVLGVLLIFRKSYPLFAAVQEKIDQINLVMRENILGIRVIKAFSLDQRLKEKFQQANDDLTTTNILAQVTNMTLWPLASLTMNLSIIGVLWFGGNLVNQGSLEIGKIIAFINYLLQMMNSLLMMVMLAMNFSRAQASAVRIWEVLNTRPDIVAPRSPQVPQGFDLEFNHVYFKYNRQGDYVLEDISFTAKEGEKIGIIGATGSGKSSLIHLIPRLYDVTAGKISIGGKDVRQLSPLLLRKQIGIVLQDSIIFSGTIEENLRLGLENASPAQMEKAALDAQAYEFIARSQASFQSPVEQRGKNLSGGQKQRLSIARTLLRDPKIFIMDDASSALDMATEARLQQSVKDRMAHCTVITIAQRITGVMNADKIIVLDQGKINAIGTHQQLLKENAIYQSIAVSQLGEEVLAHV